MNMQTIQTSLWFDHYQGAVYPLHLTAEPNHGRFRKKNVKSLVDLCSQYIVRDSSMTLSTIQYIPAEICISLMQEALLDNRDRAMEVLISHWPMETLSLRKLTPNLFTSVLPLFDSAYLSDIVRQCLRYTTCLSHTFLECLKKRTPTKLKYLDMTGFPTAEVILFYLSTHCMLAHNEARQTIMVDMYNSVVNMLPETAPESARCLLSADSSLPDASFVIKLDAFVTSDQTLSELCKALKVSSFPSSTLRIWLEKLDVTCLGEQKLNILMQQVNPQYLTGLRFKYNSLNCADFLKLSPVMEKFNKLVSLDLSCNNINVYQSDIACDRLGELLSKLPELKRLDLSNNRIKTRLRRVLCNMQKPLEYLRLSACGLTLTDMAYLSVSHHVTGLREVDISENSLQPAAANVGKLIQGSRSQLLTVELEDCGLNDEYLMQLDIYTRNLESILYINLAENLFSFDSIEMFCRTVARSRNLKVLRLPYPIECYASNEEDPEVIERTKKDCVQYIVDKMICERQAINMDVHPKLVMVDLERRIYDLIS